MNETVAGIMKELKSLGSEQYKKVLRRHGATEPFFGVKIEYLQQIRKRIKTNHPLAIELYATGNSDAMYLAGMLADPLKMSKMDLQRWMKAAPWLMISEFVVATVAAANPHGFELALKWIENRNEKTAAAGWCTLSQIVKGTDDALLDLKALKQLIERIEQSIHSSPNRVRYSMNGFLIAAGSGVKDLTPHAVAAARKIGKVTVDMGDTDCKVPDAVLYIEKVQKRGEIGKKRAIRIC